MLRCRVLGIQVVFNWFFFLGLFVYALLGQLAETIIVFLVVLLHEFSHTLVARAHGLVVREVELYPFGGIARLDDLLEYDPAVESRVALAGPLSNFFLVGLAIIVDANFNAGKEMVLFFIRANLMVAFFNLLPSLPLDGGRVLRANLSRYFGFRQATIQAAFLGKAIAVILLVTGVIAAYYNVINVSLILVSLFMFGAAHREQSRAVYLHVRHLARKHRELDRSGILRARYLVAEENTPLKDIIKMFNPKSYQMILVVTSGFQVKGTLTEGEIIDVVLKKGLHLPVKKLLTLSRN